MSTTLPTIESPAQPEADMTRAATAPAAPSETNATLEARVEALLVYSSRPISLNRLAEILGLVVPEALAVASSDSSESAQVVVPPKRRKKAGSTAGDPLDPIRAAITSLNRQYETSGRSFRIEMVAGGFRLMTLPAFAGDIASLAGREEHGRLSRAALETLAIIAYRQPVTRATLEAIRGVACGETLKTLLDRRLITIAGRADELGRPLLYATTRQFLEAFGLASLKDLPPAGELVPSA